MAEGSSRKRRRSEKDKRKSISADYGIASPIHKSLRFDEGGVVEYRKGAIRKIVLHNFLTFDDVTIEPSPQLNVIVGPNGTGKSSLVCAMCIGLCGHTSLLGRAKDLKDFVKVGKAKQGFVEITLHNDNGNHVTLKRQLYKDTNSTKWYVNGREEREHKVKEVINNFNVQLDNKCQFLPQDKVVEFAKLDCYQLLEETEKAIGKENMYELHQNLKGMKNQRLDLERKLDTQQKELENVERQNQLMERDVRRLKTRKESLETIKHLRWKKSWFEYEDSRRLYEEARKKRKVSESEYKELHDAHQPIKDKLNMIESVVQQCHNKLQSQRTAIRRLDSHHVAFLERLKDLRQEQNGVCDNYEQKKKDEAKRLEDIKKLKEQIQSVENDLLSHPSREDIAAQMSAKTEEINKITRQFADLQSEQEELMEKKSSFEHEKTNYQVKLSEMNDVYKQRIDKLAGKDRDTYNALKWLDENRHLFQKPVHNPIVSLLHIKDMRYSRQIESFFSGRDLYAFVFESKADHETFAKEIRDKRDLRIAMVLAPSVPLNSFKCSVSMDTLKSFGFHHMMIDLIEAPPPVLAYFCQHHFLHTVPVGDQLTSGQISSFTNRHPNIQRFYTRDQLYIVKRSRYRNTSITRSDQLWPCFYFVSSVDEKVKANLSNEVKRCEDDIARLSTDLSKLTATELELRQRDKILRSEKNELREKVTNRRKLQTLIEQRNIKIRQLESNPINLDNQLNLMKSSVINNTNEMSQCLVSVTEHAKDHKRHILEKIHFQLDLTTAEVKKREYSDKFRDVTNKLKDSEATVKQHKDEEAALKDQARKMLKKASDLTGVNKPDELPPEIKAIFRKFPEDSAQLEELIHEHQTKVDMCSSSLENNGEDTIRQFERNDRMIIQLRDEIRKIDDELHNHEENATQLRDRWLIPLKNMIKEINTRFSTYFTNMNCVGEVSLEEHENDFSKYGVLIRVKFRSKDDLHVLDSHHQSGGERSVSTMLYLMSLQDITKCSFRVVDEINQGMDSRNERGVFDQIVNAVSQVNTSQYFLLTPKLLQDLTFTPAVTVHIIHNGANMTPLWNNHIFH